MARTWLSVTVELLGGRSEDLWPWPGRVFAVGPSHTFADLADAINDAFARWDRSHLSMFTLADGRMITDARTGDDLSGPIAEMLDIDEAKVARVVELGAEFQFTFDFGDDWIHRCVVGEAKVDPVDVLGGTPRKPLPYWGWGAIPDQHGRRWADDDGRGRIPTRPSQPHPMVLHAWPGQQQVPPVDTGKLRAAIATGDAASFLAALKGTDIDSALQHVGSGISMALERRRDEAESVAVAVINRLTWRMAPGDEVLAEDLLACLRGEPLAGRIVPVDLDMLSEVMEGDSAMSTGGYVDLHTGDVFDDGFTDSGVVGEDAVIDVEEDPDRWLEFDISGSRDGWRDMASFVEQLRDAALRDRLERAIEGKGAFRRFRDIVQQDGMGQQWTTFADDRKLGRARAFLANAGIRVGSGPRSLGGDEV